MGNTQCCHAKEENDYKSQVLPEAAVNLQPKENLPPNISQKGQKDEKPEEILEIPIPEPPITIEVVEEKPVEIPILHPIIRLRLESEKFFEDKLKGELKVRKFGEEVYEGQLDQNSKYPHGYGRMYKADGSLYVGHFQHGKAEGQGVYLSPDGLLYNGHFHNNNAQGIGKYEYSGITYEGHFLNNRFNGTGKEKSESYEFEGEYYEGQRTHGVFKWENEKGEKYIYTGHFFKNKFHGEGILGEPKGTYAGSFIDGHKDGRGIYKYTTGLRYQGEYRKGVKQGKGIIYNFNNTIAYEGEFENDMPHGKGYIYDDERNRHSTIWVEGIDSSLL